MKTSIALYFYIALVVIVVLVMVACGVLSTLQVIVEATAAAVPILQAAGVPVPAAVPLYVAAVAECIGNADVADPTTGQLVTIANCLASQIAPILPAGTPSAVASIIQAIINDVGVFLSHNEVASMRDGTIKPRAMTAREASKFHALTSKARSTAAAARKLVK
jgi:hypothetical protein